MPALLIHTSTPPHSATVASATDSLKPSTVTSPLQHSEAPGSSRATSLRSASVRATRVTRAPPCEKAWARRRPRPRPAPVITTRLPSTSPPWGKVLGIGISSLLVVLLAPYVCTDKYNTCECLPTPNGY